MHKLCGWFSLKQAKRNAESPLKTIHYGKVEAFIDTYEEDYVDLALKMGVPADRINTIIDFDRVAIEPIALLIQSP